MAYWPSTYSPSEEEEYERLNEYHRQMAEEEASAEASTSELTGKIERLCAALGPFARAAEGYDAADWAGAWPDDYPIIDSIKVGDYRRARSVLRELTEHNGVADGSPEGRAAYAALTSSEGR